MTSGLKRKLQNGHHVHCVPAKRFEIEPLRVSRTSDLDYTNNARLSHQGARQLFDVLDNPTMKLCQKSSGSTNHIQKDRFNFPENCKSQDTMIMSAWLDEWQTAPKEPLPSNLYALSLLKESAGMNQEIHVQSTREAPLDHHYPSKEPGEQYWTMAEEDQKRGDWEDEKQDSTVSASLDEWSREQQEVLEVSKHASRSLRFNPTQFRTARLYPHLHLTKSNTMGSKIHRSQQPNPAQFRAAMLLPPRHSIAKPPPPTLHLGQVRAASFGLHLL
jgi:hypothetical protein